MAKKKHTNDDDAQDDGFAVAADPVEDVVVPDDVEPNEADLASGDADPGVNYRIGEIVVAGMGEEEEDSSGSTKIEDYEEMSEDRPQKLRSKLMQDDSDEEDSSNTNSDEFLDQAGYDSSEDFGLE